MQKIAYACIITMISTKILNIVGIIDVAEEGKKAGEDSFQVWEKYRWEIQLEGFDTKGAYITTGKQEYSKEGQSKSANLARDREEEVWNVVEMWAISIKDVEHRAHSTIINPNKIREIQLEKMIKSPPQPTRIWGESSNNRKNMPSKPK